MSDPINAIVNRLRQCCKPFAVAELIQSRTDRWQSLLYDGGRHHIELRVEGERTDDAIESVRRQLADDAFTIPGHVITEIRLAGIDRGNGWPVLIVEAATIEA